VGRPMETHPVVKRERKRERERGDEGGQRTFDCAVPVVAADMGKTSHQPDDGTQEFTIIIIIIIIIMKSYSKYKK